VKVLVTGGTGFVGSHSVAALWAAGHSVRMLVRSRDRIAPALDPLGVSGVEAVEGDCTDPVEVRGALDGCDAVLHCASVFSWSPHRQARLVAENTAATEQVLTEAADRGLDPIVHVSSYVALLPSDEPLTTESEPGPEGSGYAASKAATERIARRLQDSGAPVVTTYPAAVIGPHDPYLGESNRLVLELLQSARPPAVGSLGCVDVRDVAATHAAVMEPGRGPRRVIVTGHDLTSAELARRVAAAAGKTSRPLAVPAVLARGMGTVMDLVSRLPGAAVPVGSGAISVLLGYPGADASSARALGLEFRPLEDTLRDTVAWLQDAGHYSGGRPRTAGAGPG
jgi:dihydroflavonol-4-reductase